MLSFSHCRSLTAGLAAAAVLFMPVAGAQTPPPAATSSGEAAMSVDQRLSELTREVEELKNLVHQLQDQVAKGAPPPAVPGPNAVASAAESPAAGTVAQSPAPATPKSVPEVLSGITVNALLDGYYEYNANSPLGRVNYLRAYDVSSNSFSLSQADLVVESAPDPAADKRYGMRVDLQYGQATSTLQGNPANELRPEVYRDIFQAYGTYIFPVEDGLTVDFGKWASSLGIEGNYTKDQLNYSRSLWFDFLPFYHMGIRSKLAIDDQVGINAWLTNGAEQSEANNDYKDWLVGLVLTPTTALNWTLNYYQGQEHPDVVYLQNPGPGEQDLPDEQGTYILPIANPPDGKLQITDSYITWQASRALVFSAEGDYVQERLYSYSSPKRVDGGALYAGYQLSGGFALAARVEYLADIGGLYSGVTQYLKEGTLTFDYRPRDGFLARVEFRRDQSNRPYFLGHTLGVLDASQPTIGVGLVWWLGQKQGAW
jgi:Putative beta-barrel porin-2, OmpL-like. bbp2